MYNITNLYTLKLEIEPSKKCYQVITVLGKKKQKTAIISIQFHTIII